MKMAPLKYWIVRIIPDPQKTLRQGPRGKGFLRRRKGEQKEADAEMEYKIMLEYNSGIIKIYDENMKPTIHNKNDDFLKRIKKVGPSFNNINDAIKEFNLITAKPPTEEKIKRGVNLAEEVLDDKNESVETNFQNNRKLAQAIVDINKRTDAQEIIDIDKILWCDGGWKAGFRPTLHLLYILFAAVIAAAGLWTNSGPSVVASMLVSTMMEPINGMRFIVYTGKTRIPRCRRFIFHSITLLVDMLICILVGMIAGSLSAEDHVDKKDMWTDVNTNETHYYTRLEYLAGTNVPRDEREKNGETRIILPGEMSSRTSVMGLVVAVVVAGASALALFYATRSDNKSALVGIGISASLLPPMVNAGMLWALSWAGKENINGQSLADMGGISFALTWINVAMILIIWISLTKLEPIVRDLLPCKKRNIPLVVAKSVQIPTIASTEFGETARLIF